MSEVAVVQGDRVVVVVGDKGGVVLEVVEVEAAGPAVVVEGLPLATEFRLPMKDLSKPWYEATRRFGPYNYHPERCEDWNTETGGNTDLGEVLVAPFSGVVVAACNWYGSTGRVVQILGVLPEGKSVVWAGWHLEDILVTAGRVVEIGEEIATIGNADGVYYAHLHEQICILNERGIPRPSVFPSDGSYDWQQPSVFYVEHGVDESLVRQCAEYDGQPEFMTRSYFQHPLAVPRQAE